MTQKLIEACGTVAAASLEQTTWLRRNVAVKPGRQADLEDIGVDLSGWFCGEQLWVIHTTRNLGISIRNTAKVKDNEY